MGGLSETRAAPLRLGEILRAQGVLSPAQIQMILDEQRRSGAPFGVLAERLCAVPPAAVQEAWVQQYLSYGTQVRLRDQRLDPQVRAAVTRRQAWQFGLVPLRREGGQLVIATSRKALLRAVRFAWRRLGESLYFVILSDAELGQALTRYYHWPALRAPQVVVLASQPAGRVQASNRKPAPAR